MNSELDEEFREACCNGNTDLMQKLINKGVDVNSQNKINGWTSLHWAAKRGHEIIVKSLLQNYADASLKNSEGKSAVEVATDEKIRNILLDHLGPQSMLSKGSSKNNSSEKPLSEQINFVPSYLKHPVFPHVSSSQSEQDTPAETEHEKEMLQKLNRMYPRLDEVEKKGLKNVEEELVLKVRKDYEQDFIEVEVPFSELTYENLLTVCCTELECRRNNLKIRKLPNTIIRKDKDVKRLEQFQELEIVFDSLGIQNE